MPIVEQNEKDEAMLIAEGDYKTLYERERKLRRNLSKRIGKLHNIASNLMGLHTGIDTMHAPSYPDLGRRLKNIAWGR